MKRQKTVNTVAVDARLTEAIRANLRGQVIDPTDPEYDDARRVWNGLIDRYPAVIARCSDTRDVVTAVRIASRYRPPVSIRGGGHQIAGSAICDDGLVIDLSAMKTVDVDPETRRARVQGGVTWGELDRQTQRFGLATPGGEVSTTGIAGFTLGGGMGQLMRAHGLACDNLRSIEIVTADGDVRTASRAKNPELFWAARGGGRGIGVVTSFEFDLHPVGPEVAVAQIFYPYEDAARILRAWPDLVRSTPETITPQLILWSVPPDPSIPGELHGEKVVIALALHSGPASDAATALAPLRELGTPLIDLSGSVSYVDIQASVDELFPAGGRYYMKSHFMDELPEAAISTILQWDARRPTPETLIVLRTLRGAVGRVGPEETAYPHRSALFNLSIDAGWSDPAMDDEAIGWARGAWDAMRPFATGGVYINFSGLGDQADDHHDEIFGRSRMRLEAIRAKYDTEGLFTAAAYRP